ncbi:MAG TPA: hypothetical protein VFF52_13250, partial [Isosphaeraceae bacterium]|nr:hypothetical protein [Isosphaeraceae bacterium]
RAGKPQDQAAGPRSDLLAQPPDSMNDGDHYDALDEQSGNHGRGVRGKVLSPGGNRYGFFSDSRLKKMRPFVDFSESGIWLDPVGW